MHYSSFIGAAKNRYKEVVAKKEKEEKERLAKEKVEQEKQNENGKHNLYFMFTYNIVLFCYNAYLVAWKLRHKLLRGSVHYGSELARA